MLIGIDGNEANVENRVGVNVYAFELLRSIWQLQKEWSNKHNLIVYLKNPPLSDMPAETKSFKYNVIPGKGLWIITKLMPTLFRGTTRPHVFFTPSHYVPPFTPMPHICSIMDLGYLEFSEQFRKMDYWQLKLWSAWSILVSKAVIAISDSTKQDIVRHYPFATGKVHVTHLGYDEKRFNTKINKEDVRRVMQKYTIVGDYILFLSTLKPSKNVEGLLKAFASISANYKLVIAGKKGWLYSSIFELVKKLKLEDRVIFTDYVSEKDKGPLISGAKVFILPSFWEGFGLDALNAMACGIPVVVSNIGSLPEVVGNAGILVDPYDLESITDGINKVLSMSKIEYNNLVAKGLSQVKNFSWEKTARQTLEVLFK